MASACALVKEIYRMEVLKSIQLLGKSTRSELIAEQLKIKKKNYLKVW